MQITLIRKPTDADWWEVKRRALVTIGKKPQIAPHLGWKRSILEARHSPIRYLVYSFLIEGIPSNTATHLVRHHVGIQPHHYGHPFSKKTLLWEKGVDPLVPTCIVEPLATWCPSGSYSHKHGKQHRGMFTKDRARNRSKTFPGIARAMIEQWAGDAREGEKES